MSESVTQTAATEDVKAADLTPVTGTSLVTEAGKTPPAATSLVTEAKAAIDPAKNADGTPKTAEQIAADAKIEADKQATKVVPEKYEIKFGDKDADAAIIEAFTPLAKELGLTNEQAQKLATFHNDQMTALTTGQAKVQNDAWAALRTQWRTEARADKEYGHMAGGKTFDENGSMIAKGLATFGTDGLRKALDDSGLGDHPEVARLLYRVGKAVSEDTIRVGGGVGNSGAPPPIANRLFPTMTS